VLDVSKIEAGQMTLELQDFCPLELTEDVVRTYSAFARAKGLQLYACIDSTCRTGCAVTRCASARSSTTC
jgi:two-component system capsular synthesis sensor histidine kinase RcsC